jgi:hypothetical protein
MIFYSTSSLLPLSVFMSRPTNYFICPIIKGVLASSRYIGDSKNVDVLLLQMHR